METAVLTRAMMQDVDCNSNPLNAELEVKKLQELVRKLERQNEQLRTRAQPLLTPATAGGGCRGGLPELDLRYFPLQGEDLGYFEPSVEKHGACTEEEEEEEEEEEALLDELELLDLDSMCSSEDSQETWLYMSQKSTDSSDSALSPLQWCRRGLSSPKSELKNNRRSLSLRLEQVSRWRSSLSSSSLSSSPPPSLTRITGMSPFGTSPSAKPCSTPQSERHAPLPSPLHPLLQRTLSPVPKDLSPAAERTPTFLPHLSKRNSRSLQRSAFSFQSPSEEDDSISLGFKLQDLTDVQVMARMQEESLRQELALPPRRSHSLGSFPSLTAAAPTGPEEECSDDDDYALPLPPPPAPRLAHLPYSHTFHALSSLSHWPRGSPPDTPLHPSATAGFGFHTPPLPLELGSPFADRGYRQGADKLRRSLVRAPSMPSVPPSPGASPRSSPCVLRSQSFDLSSGLSFLHSATPPPGPLHSRVQSVGSFSMSRAPVKATAYVSPTVKSPTFLPPSPSSGIPLLGKHLGTSPASPRPASFIGTASSAPRSKVAQSGRSFLTPPKSLSALSALRDNAWRDGCY